MAPRIRRVRYADVHPISDADLTRVKQAAIADLLESGAGEEDRLAMAVWLVGLVKRIEQAEERNGKAKA